MLSMVSPRPPSTPPLTAGEVKTLDWDAHLSIEMIRTHTKTDDVLSVTDDQLRLYRSAAVEAAERYTGMLLAEQRTVTEPIEGPSSVKWGTWTYRHRLAYPVADGIVYLYGSPHAADNRMLMVKPGTRNINVPIVSGLIDTSNCCDPCASHHINGGMMAAYCAGVQCIDKVPSGVVLGMLMYISWALEHPGDELLTQRNRIETRAGLAGLQGSNNIAMISGALELWRTFDNEAI